MAEPDLTPGRWALVRGTFQHSADLFRIDSVSERQIRNDYDGQPNRYRVAQRQHVLATFPTYAAALLLKRKIDDVRAELGRCQNAAAEAATLTINALVQEARDGGE